MGEYDSVEETTENQMCAVCGLNPGESYASGLGPVSYTRCETCIDKGAESIGVICLHIWLQGGPAAMAKHGSDGWWPNGVRSFLDGRYVGWQEIRGAYAEYEATFKKGVQTAVPKNERGN